MLYQTIDNASQFRDQFHRCGRGDQFSYEALGLIFDYLSDCGSDVELDVVAICCEFSENDPAEIAKDYSLYMDDSMDEDEIKTMVLKFLEDNTSVVDETSTGNFVYVQF
jgi:hypothetical protein